MTTLEAYDAPRPWRSASARRPCVALVAVVLLYAATPFTLHAESASSLEVMGEGEWVVAQGADPDAAELEAVTGDVSSTALLPEQDETTMSALSLENPRWQLQASFVDGERLEGTIAMRSGQALLVGAGRVSARVRGAKVWGDILDDSGDLFATFEGVVGPAGLQGTFTGRNDERGSWSWSGALPRPPSNSP